MKGLCQLLGYDRIFLQRALWSPLELCRKSKNYKDNLYLRYLFTLSIFSLLVESDSSRSAFHILSNNPAFCHSLNLSLQCLELHKTLAMLSIDYQYEGHKIYHSLFSYHLFQVFQASFLAQGVAVMVRFDSIICQRSRSRVRFFVLSLLHITLYRSYSTFRIGS